MHRDVDFARGRIPVSGRKNCGYLYWLRITREARNFVPPMQEDPMRLPITSLLLGLLVASPARAALPNGAQAPDFQAEASLGGKTFKFSLAEALKKGPVVLYFYPAAFTPGCTAEAPRLRPGDGGVSGTRCHRDRRIARHHRYAYQVFRQRMPQQVRGRGRHQPGDHEVVRRGPRAKPRICGPNLIRDRAKRAHRLFVHESRSWKACRKYADGTSRVAGESEEAMSKPFGLARTALTVGPASAILRGGRT